MEPEYTLGYSPAEIRHLMTHIKADILRLSVAAIRRSECDVQRTGGAQKPDLRAMRQAFALRRRLPQGRGELRRDREPMGVGSRRGVAL
jgi:hypothetical protein